MHERLELSSWFVWVVYGCFVAVVAAAIAVVVNVLRRPRTDFGSLGRAPWLVVQGGLLALSAIVMAAGVLGVSLSVGAPGLAAMGLLLVLAVAQQIAYLLRVVFPSPKRSGIAPPPSGAGEAGAGR